jgi:hypothetical protein
MGLKKNGTQIETKMMESVATIQETEQTTRARTFIQQ